MFTSKNIVLHNYYHNTLIDSDVIGFEIMLRKHYSDN